MVEPVSLELAKMQLRLDSDAEDLLVNQSISAAREWVERYTGHLLVRRDVVEAFPSLASTVNLRAWPNVEVKSVVIDGVTIASTAYVLSPIQRPAQLAAAAGQRWTNTSPVNVTLTAGYALADVPARFVRAMLILIADIFTNRESSTITPAAENAAKAFCRNDRRRIV